MLKLLLRLLLLLVTLVGIGIAFVMPWAAEHQDHVESGRWRVYDRTAGFRDVTVEVPETPGPWLALDITTLGPLPANHGGAILAVTAARDGRTVLAEAVDLAGVPERMVAPQNAESLYSVKVAELGGDRSGQLHFRFTRGDAELDRVIAIDMVLASGTFQPDPQLLPVGYVLLVVGFVGLVTSFRTRKASGRTEPQPPRWGR